MTKYKHYNEKSTPNPDKLKQELETMPFEKLQKIALELQELLNNKNIPVSMRPVIDAVINEMNHRKELLVAESAALQKKATLLLQQVVEREREAHEIPRTPAQAGAKVFR